MKLGMAIFIYFIISILFIMLTLFINAEKLYNQELEEIRLSKIQKTCMKAYKREKKLYVPKRSTVLAQKVINQLLKETPITFNDNAFSLDFNGSVEEVNVQKQVLTNIVNVVNHLKVDSVLTVSTYTDTNGSAQTNLALSQKRADSLKKYFLKRTNVLFIAAIGYGEALPLTSRRVEINLQKVP